MPRAKGQTQVRATPVHTNNLSAALNCDNKEKLLAGYLGFRTTGELRQFSVSWPIQKCVIDASEIWQYLARSILLETVQENELKITGKSIDAWEPHTDDSKDVLTSKRYHKLVWLLLRLEKDLELYQAAGSEENRARALQYQEGFLRSLKAVSTKVPNAEIQLPELMEYPIPQLGPFTELGECRLEKFNRILEVVKYVQSNAATPGNWRVRMRTRAAISTNELILPKHLPTWMQKDTISTLEIPRKTKATDYADMSPIQVAVTWDTCTSSKDQETFEAALKRAREKNIPPPPKYSTLHHDARLCEDEAMFRDMLRRHFDTHRLGVDFVAIVLEWKAQGKQRGVDIFGTDWETITCSLSDTQNSDFIVTVQFCGMDDPSQSLFETSEFPPWLQVMKPASASPQAGDKRPRESLPHEQLAGDYHVALEGNALDHVSTLKVIPRYDDNEEKLLQYYEGKDVRNPDERLRFQTEVLRKVTANMRIDLMVTEKVPSSAGATPRQLEILDDAARAFDREAQAEIEHRDISEEYYVVQKTFSGSPQRVGPPVDLCRDLLLCEVTSGNRYRPQVLGAHVRSEFYLYQVTGAVGLILKLIGKIPAKPLLDLAGVSTESPEGQRVILAAERLEDLCIHGAIMADETGFGKTKQCLLASLLYAVIAPELECRPTLLLVPPALIMQWLDEIKSHWPFFTPILSHGDTDLKRKMTLQTLTPLALRKMGKKVPSTLRFVFDKKDPRARRAVIISSYETHAVRTSLKVETESSPGVPYQPPRFHPNGDPDWEIAPEVVMQRDTNHREVFGLLIADEAHKVKNKATGIWELLNMQHFTAILLSTATPIFNSIQDLLGLIELLGRRALEDLMDHADTDAAMTRQVVGLQESLSDEPLRVNELLQPLPQFDIKRLAILTPGPLRRILLSKRETHREVATYFRAVLDAIAIQRSQASVLPLSHEDQSQVLPLKSLCHRVTCKTAVVDHLRDEKAEYQLWHKKAADELVLSIIQTEQGNSSSARTVVPTSTLRLLGLANFSTRLARLNQRVLEDGASTYAEQLTQWRDQKRTAEFIWHYIRTSDAHEPTNASSLIQFLCEGSPALRLLFREVKTQHVLEKLNKEKWQAHQKLLVGVLIPANGWYAEVVLKELLVGVRTYHAGLSHTERAEIIDKFNDPESELRVLIMHYETGGFGLNLHKACNRVVLLDSGRSRSQEAQLAGRCLRITSEFDLTIIRRFTPDSFDLYKSVAIANKASLQLAINARDPDICKLVVRLLNQLQPRINDAHANGQTLLDRMEVEKQAYADEKAAYLLAKAKEVNEAKEESEIQSDALELQSRSDRSHSQRQRMEPKRYNPMDYDPSGYKVAQDPDLEDEADHTSDGEKELLKDPNWQLAEDEKQEELEAEIEYNPSSTGDDEEEDAEDLLRLLGSTACSRYESNFDTMYAKRLLTKPNQPSDEEREQMELLRLPKDKIWTEEDLEEERWLKLGLRLLYNHAHGIESLQQERSIHVCYDQLPSDYLQEVTRKRQKTSVDLADD